MPLNKQLVNWLIFAEDDLKAAEISLNENLTNIVCFHSQQAAEKSLKALYIFLFDTVPKIHDLIVINNKLKNKLPEIVQLDENISFLNKFYTPTRYPDTLPGSLPEGLPDSVDAKKALSFAKEIYDFVKNKLKL